MISQPHPVIIWIMTAGTCQLVSRQQLEGATIMTETRRMVIGLLQSYAAKKARLEQLQYELGYLMSRSEQDIIQELALKGATLLGGGAHRGYVSDKTMKIALEYHDISLRMSNDAVGEILLEYGAIEAELERLEKYVSLLDEQKAAIIRQYYFERRPWDYLENELHATRRTLQRRRDYAIDELATMYTYISKLERNKADSTGDK